MQFHTLLHTIKRLGDFVSRIKSLSYLIKMQNIELL